MKEGTSVEQHWRTWTEDFSYRHVVIEAPISEDDQVVALLRSSWRSSPLFSLPSGKSRKELSQIADRLFKTSALFQK